MHEVDNVYIADPAAHASAPEGTHGSDAPVGNTLAHLARLLGDEHRRGDRAPRPAPMSIRSDEIAHLQVSDAAIPEVQSGRVQALRRPQALKRPDDDAEELWVQDDLDRAIEQGVDSDPGVAMPAPEDAPPMAEAAAAAAAAALRRPSEARSLGDAFALVADHLRAVSDAEDVFIADAEGLVLANTGADEPLVATTPLLRFATWRLMPWLHIDGAPIDRLSLALGDGRALALHWVALSEETAVVVGVVLKRSAIDSTHATLHKMLDADFAARWDL